MTKIKDFKKEETVEFECFIASLNERKTAKGDPFISIVFKDETGEISGNIWKTSLESFGYSVNDVVTVFGKVSEYAGNMQIVPNKITFLGKPISTFLKTSEKNADSMFKELLERHINTLTSPLCKFILDEMIVNNDTLMKLFTHAPAAKGIHHPYIHGLLEHVLGLCNMADSFSVHYKQYFPFLDMDKVKVGLILHDWGKIYEYEFSTPNIQYTKIGVLQHHIGIATEMVARTMVKWEAKEGVKKEDREYSRELLHIIYSHHGELEWGALVKPATVEAQLVHQLDYMDSKMMHIHDLIGQGQGDIVGLSKRSFTLGNSFLLQKLKE